jgi:CubicO group peptidase (beta-lactamase class C family)
MRISLRLVALICILARGAGVARAHQSDDSLSAKVDEVVRTQMREQNIPGVSLAVMRNGKIIKATGYGLANVELNVPVTPQMVFNPGSVAKAFTATAVMMLVEERKIELNDKISKYLTEAPTAWDEITIRRLLTHTSGLRDYFGEDGDPQYDFHQDYTEDELVRKFAAQTLRSPAGEQWRYNNAGYVILGVVIHRVTGKLWFDFVKERIFDPLGMTSTRLLSTDDIIANRASGYQMVNGQRKNAPWIAPSWLTTADGSLCTNVFDMAKWDAALYTEKLIKRSTLEQMWTPVKLNNGTTYPYGFAWRVSEVNGHRLIQHDGVDYGFTSRFARYVNDGLSVIAFINLGEDDEAVMPRRITDNVAAIYIPGLKKGQAPSAAASTVSSEPDAHSPPAPHSVESEILEIDRAWGQTYVNGDIDVIDRTLASDWRGWLDTAGSDKATELAEFRAGKNRSLENIIDDARVRVYDNSAVVEARERIRFRDESGEHWLTWHITDVFVKQDNRWQVVASHGSTIPNP